MRIGLLGGSFNPAHKGHLYISTVAIKRLQLDEVWWLVSPQNPLKQKPLNSSLKNRLKIAKEITKGHKIRVNSVHPGVIQTDMGEQTFVSRAQQHGTNDIKKSRDVALAGHPIGRLGVPEDIAKGIVFLASDDAGFMTGSSLVIDGGLTAR